MISESYKNWAEKIPEQQDMPLHVTYGPDTKCSEPGEIVWMMFCLVLGLHGIRDVPLQLLGDTQ